MKAGDASKRLALTSVHDITLNPQLTAYAKYWAQKNNSSPTEERQENARRSLNALAEKAQQPTKDGFNST